MNGKVRIGVNVIRREAQIKSVAKRIVRKGGDDLRKRSTGRQS